MYLYRDEQYLLAPTYVLLYIHIHVQVNMFASMYLGVNERGEFFPLRAMFVPMGGFVLKKLASRIEVI
jgi:hypothetical protein